MRVSEPIERSGYFWLPGNDANKAPGTLRISDGGNISLEIVGSFSGETSRLGDIDRASDLKRIIGHVEKEGLVTLERCFFTKRSFSFGGIAKSEIAVNWAVLGVAFDEDEEIKFDTFHASIEGLDQWIGQNGITTIHEEPWDRFTVNYQRPDTIQLLVGDEASVDVQFGCTIPSGNDLTATNISHTTSIALRTPELQDSTYFIRILGRLKEFLSFALDETVTITSATAYNSTITVDYDGGVSNAAKMYVYYGAINHVDSPPKLGRGRQLFHYADIAGSAGEILTAWLALYDTVGPAMHLYFSTKAGAHKFLESRFLALAQALETLHRRTSHETVMAPEVYEGVVDSLINACPSDHIEWLKQRLTYGNEISLSRRIKVLLKSFPKQFGSRSERGKLAQMITDTRNYLTHFDERLSGKAVRKRKLWVLCLKMEALLQLHLLATLQFREEQIAAICGKLVLQQKLELNFDEE